MKDLNESGDTSDSFENISIGNSLYYIMYFNCTLSSVHTHAMLQFTENLKYEKKVREIKYFLLNTPVTRDAKYLEKLRSFALSEGGLVNGNEILEKGNITRILTLFLLRRRNSEKSLAFVD